MLSMCYFNNTPMSLTFALNETVCICWGVIWKYKCCLLVGMCNRMLANCTLLRWQLFFPLWLLATRIGWLDVPRNRRLKFWHSSWGSSFTLAHISGQMTVFWVTSTVSDWRTLEVGRVGTCMACSASACRLILVGVFRNRHPEYPSFIQPPVAVEWSCSYAPLWTYDFLVTLHIWMPFAPESLLYVAVK